jgi:hypothetical protein
MNNSDILSHVCSEITVLRQVRALLAGQNEHVRPSKNAGKKRTMSAAARARIGAATKARWAAGKMGMQSMDRIRKQAVTKKAA